MPELRPFRALRYDPAAVPDASVVLCPPFDVISPAERQRLAALDPRNAVHVELPQSYDEAAATFARWIDDGTLNRDDRPFVYLYEQRYELAGGGDARARGFFARLTLEPFGPASGVRPHELTHRAAKEDRYELISAVRANVSPVLFLYDAEHASVRVATLLDQLMSDEPTLTALGPGGLPNRMWVIDPAASTAAAELLALAAGRPLTIADGHHRYETALRYREVASGANHVLALLYEARSGGLALLPWHRLLSGVDAGALLRAAGEWFALTECDDSDALHQALASGQPGVVGIWTRAGGALLGIDRARVAAVVDNRQSETVRWLDVSVVSSTLSRMIGESLGQLAAEGRLTYPADPQAATAAVDSGDADVALIMPPTPVTSVLEVAAAGDFMPQKSTLFYPKAATGLVFNPLDA